MFIGTISVTIPFWSVAITPIFLFLISISLTRDKNQTPRLKASFWGISKYLHKESRCSRDFLSHFIKMQSWEGIDDVSSVVLMRIETSIISSFLHSTSLSICFELDWKIILSFFSISVMGFVLAYVIAQTLFILAAYLKYKKTI
jgi:hypothetical protein